MCQFDPINTYENQKPPVFIKLSNNNHANCFPDRSVKNNKISCGIYIDYHINNKSYSFEAIGPISSFEAETQALTSTLQITNNIYELDIYVDNQSLVNFTQNKFRSKLHRKFWIKHLSRSSLIELSKELDKCIQKKQITNIHHINSHLIDKAEHLLSDKKKCNH